MKTIKEVELFTCARCGKEISAHEYIHRVISCQDYYNNNYINYYFLHFCNVCYFICKDIEKVN